MKINFYFRKHLIGVTTKCDFIEVSKYKGLTAYGLTPNRAMKRLSVKWNKRQDKEMDKLVLATKDNPNVTIEKVEFNLIKN